MTTIYHQIDQNRGKTILFFLLFILLFTGFFYLIGEFYGNSYFYALLGLVVSFTSSIFTYFYSDKIVLSLVGARQAKKDKYFNLYTVVENLSMASGLPQPKVYIINDPSPNAFATGCNPKNSVVVVTTGLLEILDRTELEGVIAHELSHIKNYDVLIASVVAVLVGTISLVSEWIIRNLWWSRNRTRSEKSTNPFKIIFLIIALIFIPFAASIMQLAISRKREYLADADAALLTRYPNGLARALEKIASIEQPPLRSASTATAHLFIVNPLRNNLNSSWLTNLFSTHPPIEERIRILRSI